MYPYFSRRAPPRAVSAAVVSRAWYARSRSMPGRLFDDSVGYGDDSGVAYHAVGLVAPEMPYRQASLLAAYVDHGVYRVGAALGLDDA